MVHINEFSQPLCIHEDRNGNRKVPVIIAADDFGLSQSVTTNISNLFYPKGIVTSTSIMANSDHLTKIKEIIDKNPNISFGIHLNITEGLSLSQSDVFVKYQLVDENGYFISSSCRRLEYQLCNSELLNAIYYEWKMQMDTLVSYGITPDHIDGHHHCHTWYGLSNLAICIAKEYKIGLVRGIMSHRVPTKINFITKKVASFLYRLGINFCKSRNTRFANNRIIHMFDVSQNQFVFSKLLQKNNICSPVLFCDYDTFSLFMNDETIINVELMCHPGHHHYEQQTKRIAKDSFNLSSSKIYSLSSYKEIIL